MDQGLNILIVDDDRRMTRTLGDILRACKRITPHFKKAEIVLGAA